MMTIEGRPVLSDKTYKKYVLEHLENWVHDAITTEDVTSQEVYDVIVKCIEINVKYHKDNFDKNAELLSLLKGHRPSVFDASAHEFDNYEYDAAGAKFPKATKKDWVDFWEETYYPEEHKQYTEEEMDAMCERAATENDKDKCREYNLREAEYYTKRAELDAENDRKKQCTCDY
jgi:hypothetical protein